MNNSIIEAKDLTLSYDGYEDIIKNTTFTIKAKEFIFITGSSGSGKSTLLKSFYGALGVKAGEMKVCGIDLSKKPPKSKLNILRRHLGIVFQDYKLVKEWSVEKNIMLPLLINGYPRETCLSQVENLLSHVKLSHKSQKFPLELSGGEQQRVSLARALSHNPIMILADEPTGNLDEYSSELVWKLLMDANRQLGLTIVVVTHNIPDIVDIPYKRYKIENGKVYEIF